jgi:hypothetical protein
MKTSGTWHIILGSGYKNRQMKLPTPEEVLDLGDVVKNINTWSYLMLIEAYKGASSNEECAKILRLFCTDWKNFEKEYGGSYSKIWRETVERNEQ